MPQLATLEHERRVLALFPYLRVQGQGGRFSSESRIAASGPRSASRLAQEPEQTGREHDRASLLVGRPQRQNVPSDRGGNQPLCGYCLGCPSLRLRVTSLRGA